MDAIAAAADWLVSSPIQRENGAFCAWIDLETGRGSFEYSEIAGYAMTTLVAIHAATGDDRAPVQARRAADWIRAAALTDAGGILTRNYRPWETPNDLFSFEGGTTVSFDAGMVIKGLADLHEAAAETIDLDTAVCIAEFLLGLARRDGTIPAIWDLHEGRVRDTGDRWSTQPGSYHAKIAIGLLRLAEMTGVDRYRAAAIELCAAALDRQQEDGRFITDAGTGSTHLHPHCYSAEGLLIVGAATEEGRFLAAAERATAWALAQADDDGGIPTFYDGDWNRAQRSDIQAQVLRLATALRGRGALEEVPTTVDDALERRLLSFQHETGGFLYGADLDHVERACVNAWCTMFAVQALLWRRSAPDDAALRRLI